MFKFNFGAEGEDPEFASDVSILEAPQQPRLQPPIVEMAIGDLVSGIPINFGPAPDLGENV